MYVNMPGHSTCTENLGIALQHSFRKVIGDAKPVLFMIACHNYYEFNGIRLNNDAQHAYPNEEEVLLQEGCEVYVMGVERDIKMANPHQSFEQFDKKELTIIYCFHQGWMDQ